MLTVRQYATIHIISFLLCLPDATLYDECGDLMKKTETSDKVSLSMQSAHGVHTTHILLIVLVHMAAQTPKICAFVLSTIFLDSYHKKAQPHVTYV
jgi:hypothetical protein